MEKSRDSLIIRTSVVGIVANVFLASFKAVVGLVSNSVAVVLDAVNNLSDALSSIITIIATKLSKKEPDKKHPLGHGRIEYISTAVISVIVLYAGITSFTESIKKIISPETPSYSTVSLIIIAVAVIVKIVLGLYVKRTGKKLSSGALVASGSDAMFDAIISASVLLAAIIYMWRGISLEAWLGAIISIVIIKSGIEMIREAFSKIIGERIEEDTAKNVKDCINSFPEVLGAYDLILHNYGENSLLGSVHIELPDTMTVGEVDALERAIGQKVYTECGVSMTGISVYSMNTTDEGVTKKLQVVRKTLEKYPTVLQMHGFYVEEKDKTIRFDIVVSFEEEDRKALLQKITDEVEEQCPGYKVCAFLDYDISD